MHIDITSKRLNINKLSLLDNSFIFELVNSQNWLDFIGERNVNSATQAIDYISSILNNPQLNYWVVRLKTNNTAIGVVTLLKRDYLLYHDIGFAFLPKFENQGFAYESTKCVFAELCKYPEFAQILAITMPTNIKSIKLLEKLNMRFDREINSNNKNLHVYSNC